MNKLIIAYKAFSEEDHAKNFLQGNIKVSDPCKYHSVKNLKSKDIYEGMIDTSEGGESIAQPGLFILSLTTSKESASKYGNTIIEISDLRKFYESIVNLYKNQLSMYWIAKINYKQQVDMRDKPEYLFNSGPSEKIREQLNKQCIRPLEDIVNFKRLSFKEDFEIRISLIFKNFGVDQMVKSLRVNNLKDFTRIIEFKPNLDIS